MLHVQVILDLEPQQVPLTLGALPASCQPAPGQPEAELYMHGPRLAEAISSKQPSLEPDAALSLEEPARPLEDGKAALATEPSQRQQHLAETSMEFFTRMEALTVMPLLASEELKEESIEAAHDLLGTADDDWASQLHPIVNDSPLGEQNSLGMEWGHAMWQDDTELEDDLALWTARYALDASSNGCGSPAMSEELLKWAACRSDDPTPPWALVDSEQDVSVLSVDELLGTLHQCTSPQLSAALPLGHLAQFAQQGKTAVQTCQLDSSLQQDSNIEDVFSSLEPGQELDDESALKLGADCGASPGTSDNNKRLSELGEQASVARMPHGNDNDLGDANLEDVNCAACMPPAAEVIAQDPTQPHQHDSHADAPPGNGEEQRDRAEQPFSNELTASGSAPDAASMVGGVFSEIGRPTKHAALWARLGEPNEHAIEALEGVQESCVMAKEEIDSSTSENNLEQGLARCDNGGIACSSDAAMCSSGDIDADSTKSTAKPPLAALRQEPRQLQDSAYTLSLAGNLTHPQPSESWDLTCVGGKHSLPNSPGIAAAEPLRQGSTMKSTAEETAEHIIAITIGVQSAWTSQEALILINYY